MPIGAYCTREDGEYLVWVSRAAGDDDYPVRYHTRSFEADGLARRIVEKYLKQEKAIKTVFITRELDEDGYIYSSISNQRSEGRSVGTESVSMCRYCG